MPPCSGLACEPEVIVAAQIAIDAYEAAAVVHRKMIGGIAFEDGRAFIHLIEHRDIEHGGPRLSGPGDLLPEETPAVAGDGGGLRAIHILPGETREGQRCIV